MERRAFIRSLALALPGAQLMSLLMVSEADSLLFQADFSDAAALDAQWQVATWSNGHPFGGSFARDRVAFVDSRLALGFGGPAGTCAEVRTRRFWRHGVFTVDMQPADVRGSISSFFLYAGVAATASHFEIDIEFIGGTPLLHTNYWIEGRNFPLDFDLRQRGIDPYARSRRYRFLWAEDWIAWQLETDAGGWLELRREQASIATPMQLMMNAWHGDNIGYARDFPGSHDGAAGMARYRSVTVMA